MWTREASLAVAPPLAFHPNSVAGADGGEEEDAVRCPMVLIRVSPDAPPLHRSLLCRQDDWRSPVE